LVSTPKPVLPHWWERIDELVLRVLKLVVRKLSLDDASGISVGGGQCVRVVTIVFLKEEITLKVRVTPSEEAWVVAI